jgi:hypothetical protein
LKVTLGVFSGSWRGQERSGVARVRPISPILRPANYKEKRRRTQQVEPGLEAIRLYSTTSKPPRAR